MSFISRKRSIKSKLSAAAQFGIEQLESRQLMSGDGLIGSYFNSTTPGATTAANTRIDQTIAFNWAAAPAKHVRADDFSARWTGYVQAETTAYTTFYTSSDDGVRLTIDGKTIIDNWSKHSLTGNKSGLSLIAGTMHTITLDYYDAHGAATIDLMWSNSLHGKQVIPQSALYSADHQAPTAVKDLTVQLDGTQTAAALSWSASSDSFGVARYDIYRDGVKVGSTNAQTRQFIDAGIVGETQYSYVVKAVDGSKNASKPSNVFSFNAHPDSAELPVTSDGNGLTLEIFNDYRNAPVSKIDGAHIDTHRTSLDPVVHDALRWTGQIEAPTTGNYTFDLKNDGGYELSVNGQTLFSNLDGRDPNLSDKTGLIHLVAGHKYAIELKYRAASNTYAGIALYWSSDKIAKQIVPDQYLFAMGASSADIAAPTNLTYGAITGDASSMYLRDVQLSWTASATKGIIGYDIYRSGANEEVGLVKSVDAKTTSVVDTRLFHDSLYTYYVVARKADGSHSFSSNPILFEAATDSIMQPTLGIYSTTAFYGSDGQRNFIDGNQDNFNLHGNSALYFQSFTGTLEIPYSTSDTTLYFTSAGKIRVEFGANTLISETSQHDKTEQTLVIPAGVTSMQFTIGYTEDTGVRNAMFQVEWSNDMIARQMLTSATILD